MDLGWPFARTRRESKAALPLVALSQLGSPCWGGRDAASLTQDGYLRNAVAYRCVRMVAEAAASVPLVTAHAGAAKLLGAPAPDVAGPLVAAWADPWPGEVRVLAGLAADAMSERAVLVQPAVIGRLVAAAGAGPLGRWDRANVLRVHAPGADFASLPEAQVLGGGNALLLETEAEWELVQFVSAELVGVDTWELSTLLRGQWGSVSAAADEGARVVMVDGALVHASVSPGEIGLDLDWRASGEDAAQALAFEDKGGLPWRVAHLRRTGDQISWVRRGADVAESWTFPEAANAGRFAVEVDTGSGFGGCVDVDVPSAALGPGVLAARVAEIGPDGRTGQWVSIGTGTS